MRELYSRLLLCVALVALFANGKQAFADTPSNKLRITSTDKLAPGQTEFGAFAVKNKINKWTKEAKAEGITLAQYTNTTLRKVFANANIPVVVDPRGVIRTLDGHHKLSALIQVQAKVGLKIPVSIDVVRDYKGSSEKAYAKHFVVVMKKGWFGANPPESAIEKVRSLPAQYTQMKDSPLRSVLGLVFDKAGLEGSWFKDYVQFKLGTRLLASGQLPAMPVNPSQNAKYLKAVAKVVFGQPQFRAFLQTQVKEQHRTAAKPVLSTASKQANRVRFAAIPRARNGNVRQARRKLSGRKLNRAAKKRTIRRRSAR